MALYDYGGIYDYLEDIHFPSSGLTGKPFPPNISAPWYYFMTVQDPVYFSDLTGKWGDGWAARHILPVIKILAADTQPEVPTSPVGSSSLEAAVDSYVARWDQTGPAGAQDPAFFGRLQPGNDFFWKVLGKPYPKWGQNWKGLVTQRAFDPNPPIGPYIKRGIADFFQRWNTDSLLYNAIAASIPPSGDPWDPLRQHSFDVPFPPQGIGITKFSQGVLSGKYFLGPIPASAWSRFLIIFTQAYAFTYDFAQLDPMEWDQSAWPPRRTSIPQREGGSKNAPSGISGKWGGVDPFTDFPLAQAILV